MQVLGLYRKREWARSAEGHVVCARFRYSDMKEAGRGAADAALCKFNGGKERFEVCPGCAVVQGTRKSVRKSCWPRKIMLPGGQWEKVEVEIG